MNREYKFENLDGTGAMSNSNTVRTAWDLIGHDGPEGVRIVGGRALYDAVIFTDDSRQRKVRLARLEPIMVNGQPKLRQVNRYVDPDTVLELIDHSAAGLHSAASGKG